MKMAVRFYFPCTCRIFAEKIRILRFKKVYIEITNTCNFSCSFCFPSSRPKALLSVEKFTEVLKRIKPFTEYIYLHVLGEPLLHPHFGELLEVAFCEGFKVNITTNGSLLTKLKVSPDVLKQVRQFNLSLHDAAENVPEEHLDDYFSGVCNFVKSYQGQCLFSLRLWNGGAEGVSAFNQRCIDVLNREFSLKLTADALNQRCTNLADGVFLRNAARFQWPGQVERASEAHACYALRDHIAILSDGSVVPCCLDADAQLKLGNIFTDDLSELISSPKAEKIKSGFQQRRAVEPLCQHCGFVLDK